MNRLERNGSIWATGAEENYKAFLTQLGQKASAAAEKHAELCEADAAQDYGRTWKRVAGMLGRLAPASIEAMGHQTLKFHIPDGKYRQQVFALTDACLGRLDLFMPDISALAIERKLISKPQSDGNVFVVAGEKSSIELMTITSDDKECPPFCKPMLGWGRKALKTTIDAIPNEAQLSAVERLCELAAETWKDKIVAAPAVLPGAR